MKYELQKGAHSVYSLYFHLIFVTKYRKKIFDSEISSYFKQVIILLSQPYHVQIVEQEIDLDHIHILFNCSPTINLTKYIVY